MSRRLRLGALTLIATLVLSACGGGGGSPGTTGGTGAGTGTGTGTGTGSGTGTTTPVAAASVTISILDGTGAALSSLSGGQTATIKATVLGADSKPVVGAIVKFTTTSSKLIVFTPDTGSALTDSTGVAVITVKPDSVTAAGAADIVATSSVGSTAVTATAGLSIGAAPLTLGTLSFVTAPTTALPPYNTIAIKIPITSGGQPVTTAPGLSLTSLCTGDNAALIVPGTITNGVMVATYTNNGCNRGRDTITATVGTSTQTISLDVAPAVIGTMQFVGSNPSASSIVLKGSGGTGRSESAQLTFKVLDEHGSPLSGVDVTFAATTYTGGLTVAPVKGTTDASGSVSTMVTSGTIPTPVAVQATATRNGVTVSGLSATLTISTGLPIQKSMSLSADKYNIEGLNYDGELAHLTVLMADQYGNPISDSSAINFITEGGAVGTPAQGACTTGGGGCSVDLKSQAFRPTNGRVTVLAYAQGIEDFVDLNGDGQYTCTNYTDPTGATTTAAYRPLVDICVSGGEPFTDQGDAFLDTDLDGVYNSAIGDLPVPYGHTGYQAAGNGRWGLNYIRRSIEIVFSGSTAVITRQVCTNGVCRDWTTQDGDATIVHGLGGANCSAQTIVVRVADVNNNPMPYGTTVAGADGVNVTPQTTAPGSVASTTHLGGTLHTLSLAPQQINGTSSCGPGSFNVVVNTPKNNSTLMQFRTPD